MAGILDALFNPTPEQNAGLLGFAANMLQASGPSRVPTSFGQALGAGLQGYQQGRDSYTQRERDRQMFETQAKLLGFKVQDAESDLKNQEAMRQRAEGLRNFYINRGNASAPQTPLAALGGNAAPTVANAERLAAANAQAPGNAGGGGVGMNIYRQRLEEAQALRAQGFGPEADAAEAAALKFQPKVKDWKQVQVGGQVMYAPLFEDGTPGAPVPYEAAVELARANTGATTELYNPMTGATVRSLQNTVSPDAALSASTTMRGQNMTDARAREFNALKQDENGIKRGEKAREADLAKSGQIASFDTMLGTLDRLKSHPGLTRSTGLYSALPTVPGSDSANFQSELETFKSQAFIPAVAQLKGMGALSDAEGKKLSAAVGALDPKMSEKAFKESLDRVVADMTAARNRVVASSSPELRQSLGNGGGAQQPTASRKISLADIAETARRSGKTTAEVTAAARARGYTIGE